MNVPQIRAVASGTQAGAAEVPLCVDLDGTLVNTDMLVESALHAAHRRPLALLALPFWLMKGRSVLKAKLAEGAKLDVSTLPYNDELLAYLRAEQARGRRLVLVTASDQRLAGAIANHLGLFDEVIASDGVQNMKGRTKADALERRFGVKGFAYAGNASADLPVWRKAQSAILVNTPASVARSARAVVPIAAEMPRRGSRLKALVRELRVYQWVKNLLVFVSPIMAQALWDPDAMLTTTVAFLGFCSAASGVYIINDLMDVEADRHHPRKRKRPFASGALPIGFGVLGPILLAVGVALPAFVSEVTALVIAFYAALSVAYSARLKERPLVDVFILATLYTVRLLAGGIASGYLVSVWLLNFSGFLFLGLACLKRCGEMRQLQGEEDPTLKRRGYFVSDAMVLMAMGVASSFVSALVMSFYVNSEIAQETYAMPTLLWGMVPLILFWQCRLWLATARGHMLDDPILYSAKDWVSWIAFGLIAVFYVLGSVGMSWL
ncbi:MAG TPA: UbiA family prenyltransferase [Alphaproteobacteria bacterium]|jgi:4-hydroxybenzoate polyprenyltransferase|nr:UbiA family prenyltransferase [Alphaproteobacteria bacterium]